MTLRGNCRYSSLVIWVCYTCSGNLGSLEPFFFCLESSMSGPVLITDKSALESLSVAEVAYLYRYFFINIPPMLIIEVMKDLKPRRKRKGEALSRVIALARKSGGLDAMINVDH